MRCFDEFGKPLKASDAIFPSIGCEQPMDFLQFSGSDSTTMVSTLESSGGKAVRLGELSGALMSDYREALIRLRGDEVG